LDTDKCPLEAVINCVIAVTSRRKKTVLTRSNLLSVLLFVCFFTIQLLQFVFGT
jgi:hypothetical protein